MLAAVPERRVRGAAVRHDPRHRGDALDVVDHRRVGEQAGARGERGTRQGASAQPLHGVDERGLLTGDVGPGALHDLNVEGETAAVHVLAEVTGGACLADGLTHPVACPRVLRAHVDVALGGARRQPRERRALEHAMRVALQQQPVDVGARIAFVAVDDDVARARRRRRGGRGPLVRRGEARSPAASQPRRGHLGDDRGPVARPHDVRPHPPGLLAAQHAREQHGTVDGAVGRDLGVAALGGPRQLVDEVRADAGLLVVERRRTAVAVAEAVDGLQREAAVGQALPAAEPELALHGRDVPAAAHREAGRARAHLHVALPAAAQPDLLEERRRAVDVGARQAELGGDRVDALGSELPAGQARLAQAVEDSGAGSTEATLHLDHGFSRDRHPRALPIVDRWWLRRTPVTAGRAQHRRESASHACRRQRPPSESFVLRLPGRGALYARRERPARWANAR